MWRFDDEIDAQDFKDPRPVSSCVVMMVEFFAVAAKEAAKRQGSIEAAAMEWLPLHWLLPSLNRLLVVGFRFFGSSALNMLLGPSQTRFGLTKRTLWRVVPGRTNDRQIL
jgi:hypothetical protein